MPPPRATDEAVAATDAVVVPVRRRWLAVPAVAGLALALVSVLLQLAKDNGFEPPSLQLDRLLNVDEDLSVLNWLTASVFLLGAVTAWAVAAKPDKGRATWLVLATVLALLSLDEAAGVHDPLSANAETYLEAGGVRSVAVIVVGLAVAVAVTVFVMRLAPPVRWRVAAALGLVVLAAVVIDTVGPDLVADPIARLKPAYVAKATVEEVLELGAAVLVLDGMLVAALTR